jgi:hypothetical protein
MSGQPDRIAAATEARARLLQEEIDRRFGDIRALMDERRDNSHRDTQHLRQQLDGRVGDVKAASDRHLADLRALLDERYATQTKALDAAFKAAEQAVAVALANAEKAVAKAEAASDARFASVNEFRQALTDQTATFLPRIEYDTAHQALADRITANADRVAALELRLTSRLDIGQGADAGDRHRRTEQRLSTGQILQVAAVAVAVLTFVIVYVIRK